MKTIKSLASMLAKTECYLPTEAVAYSRKNEKFIEEGDAVYVSMEDSGNALYHVGIVVKLERIVAAIGRISSERITINARDKGHRLYVIDMDGDGKIGCCPFWDIVDDVAGSARRIRILPIRNVDNVTDYGAGPRAADVATTFLANRNDVPALLKEYKVRGDGTYHEFMWNCETFVTFCRTGKMDSQQDRKVALSIFAVKTAIAIRSSFGSKKDMSR